MVVAYLIEPPFNYRNGQATVTGCDVELARTVLALAGLQDVELIEAEFAQLLPGLADGRWHMTTGLFVTEERREVAAFSRPIWALPDGLLVAKGNPLKLAGYRAAARLQGCRLAVIRDQVQHRSAIALGVPSDHILIFETHGEATQAVLDGRAHAYASVARAHQGYIALNDDAPVEVVTVPPEEKQPAFGCFGFGKSNDVLRRAVDDVLKAYLGSSQHRLMMSKFGFVDAEIDRIAPRSASAGATRQ